MRNAFITVHLLQVEGAGIHPHDLRRSRNVGDHGLLLESKRTAESLFDVDRHTSRTTADENRNVSRSPKITQVDEVEILFQWRFEFV